MYSCIYTHTDVDTLVDRGQMITNSVDICIYTYIYVYVYIYVYIYTQTR